MQHFLANNRSQSFSFSQGWNNILRFFFIQCARIYCRILPPSHPRWNCWKRNPEPSCWPRKVLYLDTPHICLCVYEDLPTTHKIKKTKTKKICIKWNKKTRRDATGGNFLFYERRRIFSLFSFLVKIYWLFAPLLLGRRRKTEFMIRGIS